jgi:hypothetical protein
MNMATNHLCKRMRDRWMDDCVVTYVESDIFKTINNEEIMQ